MEFYYHYPKALQEAGAHAQQNPVFRSFDVHLQDEILAGIEVSDRPAQFVDCYRAVVVTNIEKPLREVEPRVWMRRTTYGSISHIYVDPPSSNFVIESAFVGDARGNACAYIVEIIRYQVSTVIRRTQPPELDAAWHRAVATNELSYMLLLDRGIYPNSSTEEKFQRLF